MPRAEAQDRATLFSKLPREFEGDLRAQVRRRVARRDGQVPLLVVLDDDPTGTQTSHDILVLTAWDTRALAAGLASAVTARAGGLFVLTNSRALHAGAARALIVEVCTNLRAAAAATRTRFEVVLRSDSTLRGHFPLEADAAAGVLGEADVWILAPFFQQGGRYTVDDVHYVDEEGTLVPAADTPFARDASFGYSSSNLRDWVVEKSEGAITRDRVQSISLQDIRTGGPDKVCDMLVAFAKGSVVVVNAVSEQDMDVVVVALLDAAGQQRRFLYRSGAALVSARLGIAPIPPKTADDLQLDFSSGGMIVAGSYVPKTTAQLDYLREQSGDALTTIELQVEQLLQSDEAARAVITRASEHASELLGRGKDVLVMTSRQLVRGADGTQSLDIGTSVARAIVLFVEQLTTRPRYVIAKGGITSSDVASKALNIKCALVVGQAAPGVPLWECTEETSKWPGIPYVVFPGNVGSNKSLFDVVDAWRPRRVGEC